MTEITELKQILSTTLTIAARSLNCYHMLTYDKDEGNR